MRVIVRPTAAFRANSILPSGPEQFVARPRLSEKLVNVELDEYQYSY